MLTVRQRELLMMIERTVAETSVAPSFDEMADALGVSKGNTHAMITRLEDRGYIRRLRGRARAIEVVQPVSGGALERVAQLERENAALRRQVEYLQHCGA